MSVEPNYLEDRICLNVLANSVENAKSCYEAAEGHVVLGVLSKNYESDEAAIKDMKKYQEATNNALSVGLGAGDPNQSQMVSRISGELQPQHVN
ncbi:MAG: KDGP aldolase, partial [Enterococcus gilvus]